MRKLVSIQKIEDIQPIKDADFIVCAKILGWKIVVKKDEFKIGDKCVYFEVDSFLPIEEKYEFLRGSSYRKHPLLNEGFRIKTQKLKNQISQGLCLSLESCELSNDLEIGTDVTKLLNVRKWEAIESYSTLGTHKGDLPFGISATDETRIQSIPYILEEFKDIPYYISTKIDGTSVTIYIKDNEIGVCSHNNQIMNDGKSSLWSYCEKINLEEKLKSNNINNIAIQGEFAGPSIQKNKLKLKTPQWFVFTIIDLNNLKRYSLREMQDLCKTLGLIMVPVEEEGKNLLDKYPDVDSLLERAKGKYISGQNKEGIVIRPLIPIYSDILNTDLSIKVLNNNFLLKEK